MADPLIVEVARVIMHQPPQRFSGAVQLSTDWQPDGEWLLDFALAMTRADVRPFTKYDWYGWSGAMSYHDGREPHMVQFHAHDLRRLLDGMDCHHWQPAEHEVTVILDAGGLTFNCSDLRGYAYQVNVEMRCRNWDANFVPAEQR